jgi:hypothetical protein
MRDAVTLQQLAQQDSESLAALSGNFADSTPLLSVKAHSTGMR